MTTSELKTILESITGFSQKVVYFEWPADQAPALPFICYYSPSSESFGADNKVYYQKQRYNVELYCTKKDEETEALVETQLTSHDIYYAKSWQYIESEKCYLTLYEIEV